MKLARSLTMSLIALGLGGAALAEDYVIVDSDAAGIEPGIVVDGGAQIIVPDGAQVEVLDPNLETRVITGPFEGTLAAAAAASPEGSTFDRIGTRGRDTKVLGAVRDIKVQGGEVSE
ncbi:MAG: hypothetical protein AAF401_03850 [Pseudomonadota bacterium]